MCKSYNSTPVVEAVGEADLVVLAVGLGANVESEGRHAKPRQISTT